MFSYLIQHSPLLYLTQSLWRDEVYSLLMSAKPVWYFASHLDFEPPFYYLLLHYWTKFFGDGEIVGRSLSLLAFTGATGIIIFWAEKLFKTHWLRWWLPLFFFFNPMLLYYSMELRTYGWYMFFATLALWAYAEQKWKTWIVAVVLGFYTHSFLLIVPFAAVLHYVLINGKKLLRQSAKQLLRDQFVRSLIIVAIALAPWLIKILIVMQKLRQSWYFPVDLNLVTSVLGNLFIGYEGTPWYLWNFTKLLSLIILIASVFAVRSKKLPHLVQLLVIQIYIPLLIVIGISFIKPLYVNRYMIAISIAEVMLVTLAIYAIKNPLVQKITAALCLLFVVGFNFWYPDKHAKLDIRSTMNEINVMRAPGDVVMADSPLIFFETIYYSNNRNRVFLYNPENLPFPWFVGESIVSPKQMVNDYPPYPIRAYVVHQNGTFDIVYNSPVSTTPR